MLSRLFLEQCLVRAGKTNDDWEDLVSAAKMNQRLPFSVGRVSNYTRYFSRQLRDVVEASDPLPILMGPVSGSIAETWSTGIKDSPIEYKLMRFRGSDFIDFGLYERLHLVKRLPMVLAQNLILWELATGEKLDDLYALGALNDYDSFLRVSKALNLAAKDFLLKDVNRPYMELQALTGYQLSSSDERMAELNADVVEMINAGPKYVPGYKEDYLSNYGTYSMKLGQAKRTLEDFISSSDWMADGGAAMLGAGKVIAQIDETQTRLRLTKRRIPYVLELEELLRQVKIRAGTCFVEAVIKPEPQKQRWIFNVDTACNVLLSYLFEGIKDYNLECHSAGEDFGGLVSRLYNMLSKKSPVASHWLDEKLGPIMPLLVEHGLTRVLPTPKRYIYWMGDIDKFDHSVQLWQIDRWMEEACRGVDQTLATYARNSTFSCRLLDPTLSTSDKSKIKYRLASAKTVSDVERELASPEWLEVNASLLSGLRTTSVLGSDVNGRNCMMARDWINRELNRDAVTSVNVRGDDSIALCDSPEVAMMFHILVNGMTSLSDQKSRISHSGEFLRLQFVEPGFSDEVAGVVGILSRSIATLGERKPTSSEQIDTLIPKAREALDAVETCVRRGARAALREFVEYVAKKALASKAISGLILGAPRSVGGLGYGRVNGSVWSRDDKVDGKLLTKTTWAKKLMEEKFSFTQLREGEAESLIDMNLSSVLKVSDDPEVKKIVRDKQVRPKFVRDSPFIRCQINENWLDYITWSRTSDFGSDPTLAVRLGLASDLARVRQTSLRDEAAPSDFSRLLEVEKKYKFSRSTAISWLSGNIGYNTSNANPELARIINQVSAYSYATKAVRDANTHKHVLADLGYRTGELLQQRARALFGW